MTARPVSAFAEPLGIREPFPVLPRPALLIRVLGFSAATLSSLLAEEKPATAALEAVVLPTVQYAHEDIWNHTPSGAPLALAATDRIAPEQRLDLLVIARRYQRDPEGRARLTYRFTLHSPNGETTQSAPELLLGDQIPAAEGALIFPREIVSFHTSLSDPDGEYQLVFEIRDHISGRTLEQRITLCVDDSNAPLPLPRDFNPSEFLSRYYTAPQPRFALAAVTAFSRPPARIHKADSVGTILGFYEQILADNPWLIPQFTARLIETSDARERRLLTLILAFAHPDDRSLGELSVFQRQALAVARREPLPTPSSQPRTGGQLDVLWGRFFASGRFAPILDLVSIAESYASSATNVAHLKQSGKQPDNALALEATLHEMAAWSLGSNAHQPLVRAYLSYLQASDRSSATAKAVAQKALNWKPAK